MPHSSMAMDALNIRVCSMPIGDNICDQRCMAGDTVVMQYPTILWRDNDGLVKVLKGESLGMVVAIFSLGQILPNKIMGQMAVHTGGGGVVTGFLPGIKLRPHDVAIQTCLWIFTKVRQAFTIVERVSADSHEKS